MENTNTSTEYFESRKKWLAVQEYTYSVFKTLYINKRDLNQQETCQRINPLIVEGDLSQYEGGKEFFDAENLGDREHLLKLGNEYAAEMKTTTEGRQTLYKALRKMVDTRGTIMQKKVFKRLHFSKSRIKAYKKQYSKQFNKFN